MLKTSPAETDQAGTDAPIVNTVPDAPGARRDHVLVEEAYSKSPSTAVAGNVEVVQAGFAPPADCKSCPDVPVGSDVNDPVELPTCRAKFVVPVTLNDAVPPRLKGLPPVTVMLLPELKVTELDVKAALGTVPKEGLAPVLPRRTVLVVPKPREVNCPTALPT